MPKKGSKKRSDIESTLNQINTIIESSYSSSKTDSELDIQLAEIISLSKTIPTNLDYKIEALDLIISGLLKKNEFDQADTAYTQYSRKLKEVFKEIEEIIERINIGFFETAEKLDPNQKLYQKILLSFEKDWKNQKKTILDELKDFKKRIDTEFDQWITQSKRSIDKNISQLKKFKNDTLKKFSKFHELLERKDFNTADKILKGTETRAQTLLANQKDALKKLSPDLHPILKNLISTWESVLNSVENEIPTLLTFQSEQLYRAIIGEQISKLLHFSSDMEQKIDNLSSLIEKHMLIMAEEVIQEIEKEFKAEFKKQRQMLETLTPKLSLIEEALILKWQKKLNHTEITIKTNVGSLKTKLELAVIEDYVKDLESFAEESQEKISSLLGLITNEKFAGIEKELDSLKKDAKKLFKQHHMLLKTSYQDENVSSKVKNLIILWEKQLEKIEQVFQMTFLDLQDTFNKRHIPHLLSKIEKFIEQNVKFLNSLLDDYHTKVMKYFESHFNNPNDNINQLLAEQNKIISQELKNKDEHVKLVFARYEDYPIEMKEKQWESKLNAVQNRFSDIKTKILGLIKERDQIDGVLDKYYEIAQPAYGYKVPLKVLSENMDIPQDRLESMLVDLISHKIIAGEIDPVTKVIVLAPRIEREVARKKLIRLRCMVCNLLINPSKEEIVHCPHCNSPAHRTHLIEWIKIKSTCPNCKRTIKII